MIKKAGVIFLLTFILSSIFLSAYVSAIPYPDFRQASETIIYWVQDLGGPLVEVVFGTGQFDEFLFSKLLLAFLIFSISYIALKQVPLFKKEDGKPTNKWAHVIIVLVVTILGVRFMSDNQFIQGVLLPYGVFAIALATFLPFFIYFYFVHEAIKGSTVGRRLAWIFFAAVFFGIWFNRWDQLGDSNWIYGLGIIGVAIAFIFDPKIHEYFGMSEFREARRIAVDQQIADIQAKISKYRGISPQTRESERTIRRLERDLVNLYKSVRAKPVNP